LAAGKGRLGVADRTHTNVVALLIRWLGFLYVCVFLAWWREAPGLIGPNGILPAGDLLDAARQQMGVWHRLVAVPSLLWLGSGNLGLHLICALGMAAGVFVLLLRWERIALAVCLACFVSLIAAAQVFASYQSDGMLVAAGFIALFVNVKKPRWWSWFSFRWLWFLIYFGSGLSKWQSGDPQWRHGTALDQYYQNLPLPNWLGWYAQSYLPHGVEVAIAFSILALELGVCWLAFGPRRLRLICFCIVTPFQLAIIATANYGFLNWLVLGLGLALLPAGNLEAGWKTAWRWSAVPLMAWVAITGAALAHRVWTPFPAPIAVETALAPFRIVDQYGLFAVMTPNRYEIEFQGSNDGEHWTAYPFRYKPQDPARRPVGDMFLFAPYQPRFEWNLWFASLANYRSDPWVEETEVRLLQGSAQVDGLFAANPFSGAPPRAVRAVIWQYWFATPEQKRSEKIWWTRRLLGLYAPELTR